MREESHLVSAIIPFHNGPGFLAEAIESVIAQTFPEWELILVDDGATDSSRELAADYCARFPDKIRSIEHPNHRNLGVTRSRNLGAQWSRGEYLAFLDSDDVWLAHKLEHQVGLMIDQPAADFLCGPSEYWYSWDPALREHPDETPSVAPSGRLFTPPDLLLASYPFGPFGAPCPSSFLIRRGAFDRLGGFVDSFNPATYQLFEDTAFLSKVYLQLPLIASDRCSERYRCHPQSIWHRTMGTTRDEAERRFYFRWLRTYLREMNITEPAIWNAVRAQSWTYTLHVPLSAAARIRRLASKVFQKSHDLHS